MDTGDVVRDGILMYAGGSVGLVVSALSPMLDEERSRWAAEPRRALLIGSRAAEKGKRGVLNRPILPSTDWDLLASAHYVARYLIDNAPRITSVSHYHYPLDPYRTDAYADADADCDVDAETEHRSLVKVRVELEVEMRDDETFEVPLRTQSTCQRDPTSVDLAVTIARDGLREDPAVVEFELPWSVCRDPARGVKPASACAFLELVPLDRLRKTLVPGFTTYRAKPYTARVAPLQWLALLKETHIIHPVDWHKHIADLHALRAANAAKAVPVHPSLLRAVQMRREETNRRRGGDPAAHINLQQSNSDFLAGSSGALAGAAPLVAHERLHELVAYGERPAFEALKRDASRAAMDRGLWDAAPLETKLRCVREEAMAIALERFLVPGLTSDPQVAYAEALLRVCTSLTKGWFRQFAIDHYPHVCRLDRDLLAIVREHADAARAAREAEREAARVRHAETVRREVDAALRERDPGVQRLSLQPAGVARASVGEPGAPGLLPDDMLVHIAQFVGLGTLHALRAVSRTLRAALPLTPVAVLHALQNTLGKTVSLRIPAEEAAMQSAAMEHVRSWLAAERQMTQAARGQSIALAAELPLPTYPSQCDVEMTQAGTAPAVSEPAAAAATAVPTVPAVVAAASKDRSASGAAPVRVTPVGTLLAETIALPPLGETDFWLDDWRPLAARPTLEYGHGYSTVVGDDWNPLVSWNQDSADRAALVQLLRTVKAELRPRVEAERQAGAAAAAAADEGDSGAGRDDDDDDDDGDDEQQDPVQRAARSLVRLPPEHWPPLLAPVTADEALEMHSEGDNVSVDPFRPMSVVTESAATLWTEANDAEAYEAASRQFVRDRAALRRNGRHVVASITALVAATSSIPHIEDVASWEVSSWTVPVFKRSRQMLLLSLVLGRPPVTLTFQEQCKHANTETCRLRGSTVSYSLELFSQQPVQEPILTVELSCGREESWGRIPPRVHAFRFWPLLHNLGIAGSIREEEFVDEVLALCAPRFVTVPGSAHCVRYMDGFAHSLFPPHRLDQAPYTPWARVVSPLARVYAFYALGLAEESGRADVLILRPTLLLTKEIDEALASNVYLRKIRLNRHVGLSTIQALGNAPNLEIIAWPDSQKRTQLLKDLDGYKRAGLFRSLKQVTP